MKTIALFALLVSCAPAARFYQDDPLETLPDPLPVTQAAPRKLSDYYDLFQNLMFHPGELEKRAGEPIPARNVNTLGEVPNGSWYVNRNYRHAMTLDELIKGAGNERPPAAGKWTIVAAKSEGVTPGFTIVDARGNRYVIKFDPMSNPEMASAADVISSKFMHALGYYVPENYIAYFTRDQLAIDSKATLRTGARKRPMRNRDIDELLAKVPSHDGRYRAMASLYLDGKPLGPFRYFGTRSDDPNDTVPHEHHRELRGLRVFSAWLGHDDSRAVNTLDMLVQENGKPVIRHHLIDFGSTLGSDSYGPNSPRSGNEYLLAWKPAAARFFTLGFHADAWERVRYPKLPSAGRFESQVFDPERWRPEYPNSAFLNMNPDDAFWAARQVVAFRDDQIRAMVATGQLSDAAAAEWIARCLIERRDKIGRAYFSRVLPIDGFEYMDGELRFRQMDTPRKFHVRWSSHDNLDGSAEYRVAEISEGRSKQKVLVYVRGAKQVVGIERTW